MAEKKKQHYVPRFYLKYFSTTPEATHIGLCVKESGKTVRQAGLKNQAYENYFYGKDTKIEDGLSEIEAKAASVIFNGCIR